MSVNSPEVVRTQTPESLFRVSRPHKIGELSVTRMHTGPWMADPAGLTAAGSIGVLVDDAVGHRIFTTRPAGKASVTSELSLDVLVPPPWDTQELRAESRMLHKDADGGFADCRVLDDSDRLIAVATTWCRYIPMPEGIVMPTSSADWPLQASADKHTLFEVLGARYDGLNVLLAPSDELTNPLGMAHGGVTIAGTEVAAHQAVSEVMTDPVVTSIRMNYVRPALLDAELAFTAELLHRGRSVSVVRVTSTGVSGKPSTLGTVTYRRAAPAS